MVRKKHLILCLCAVALLVSAFVINNGQKVSAVQQKTMKEFFASIGDFVKGHKELLSQSSDSLQLKNINPDEIIAEVDGWPITVGELEFRKGIRDVAGLSSKVVTYNEVFNDLVEEKVILSFAQKNNVLPTKSQVNEFIEIEKEWYNDNEGGYKEMVDSLLESSGMTIDEYWTTYEWYNAFRLVTNQNCYELAVKWGKEKGEIPETEEGQMTEEALKKADEYWGSILKENKEKAAVKIKDDKGLNLSADLENLHLR